VTLEPDAGDDFLFILGTGRCGSTVVQELLARHPDVGFVSNVDTRVPSLNLRGRWNSWAYDRTPSKLSRRDRLGLGLVQSRIHYGPSEAYALLSRQVSPLISEPWRDLTAEDVTPWLRKRFRRFFVERAIAQKKPFFLHKFTGWPRAAFIHEIFPRAKLLHIIRDGRAVASSVMQRAWWRGHLGPERWGFGPLPDAYADEWRDSAYSFVALAGIEWKVMIDAFEVAKKAIPQELWMEVRYEQFVEEPRRHTRDIMRFVGLDWTEEFERRFLDYPFSSNRKQSFRKDLSSGQVSLLDNILRDHLGRLGYPPEEGAPPERELEARDAP
jgi:hypothetical protein